MADVLAFVEQRDGQTGGAAREAIGVAADLANGLGGAAHAFMLGGAGASSAASGLGASGAASVHVGEHDALTEYAPEAYAQLVADHVKAGAYGAVVFAATTLGKDLAPRVAALLDVPLAADVTSATSDGGTVSVTRPVFAGKAFASMTFTSPTAVITIRPNVFAPSERTAAGTVETFTPDVDPGAWKARVVERKAAGDGALDVSEATVVVSGGRGMKDPDQWAVLEGLRDALGAGTALGASRAVVDAGWRPHGEQVGQTGKTVAPKLYFAVGISGAIQHLAGMRTSKTIVAINKDPDAPIFGVADYGIVGDLFEVVPRVAEEIAALKAGD